MAMGSEENNITKSAAKEFMSMVKNRDKSYVIDALVHTTLYGRDYPSEQRYGRLEMSYYCRAFNITEYNVSKQKNRIKGRYKKYEQIPGIENYLRQLLTKFWPAFPSEQPRMDDLLKDFANGNIQQKSTVRQNSYLQTDNQAGYQNNTEKQVYDDSENVESLLSVVVTVLVLVAIVVFLLKSCSSNSGKISSLWTSIKNFFINVLIFISTAVGILIPVICFFKAKIWRYFGTMIGGIFLFFLSAAFFETGETIGLVIGMVIWLIGLALWWRKTNNG